MTFGLLESFERLFRFDVVNNSGEVIPPFACMELDYEFESGKSALSVNGSTLVVSVKKPTADNLSSPERFLINGPMSIAVDGFGSAYKLPILQVLMDIATTPSPGDTVGPTADSWLLSSSGSGWVVKSLDSGDAYVDGDTASVFVESVSSGSSIKYCVLAADAISCPVLAYRGTMDDSGAITANDPAETFDLYFHSELLSAPKVARRGYPCMYAIDDQGRDSFIGNPCIDSCDTEATIDAASLLDGEVGTAYTGTVAVSGLDADGVTATGLPDGLSLNPTTGAITGTPTTPGTYEVLFQGEDEFGCDLSVIEVIIIFAEGDGPEPPVEEP